MYNPSPRVGIPIGPGCALADDRFEFMFHPQGWSGPELVSLEFERNRTGVITGFGLSLGSERGIIFERR